MRAWLKEARVNKGMTMQELASMLGISWQSISYYENGMRRPSPETAIRVGKILGIDWRRFYDDERKEGKGA